MLPVLRVSKNYFFTMALIAGLSSISRAEMADNEALTEALTKVPAKRQRLSKWHVTLSFVHT